MSTFQLQPGTAFQCLSVRCAQALCLQLIRSKSHPFSSKTFQIPIKVIKEHGWDANGQPALRCGFRIGGGIDQDFRLSPGFTDSGIYVTGECVRLFFRV